MVCGMFGGLRNIECFSLTWDKLHWMEDDRTWDIDIHRNKRRK